MKHSIIKFIVPKIYHIKLQSFNWTSWTLSDALSINWQPAETTKRGEDDQDALYLGWLKGVTVVSVSNPVKIPTRKTRFMSWMMSSLDFKLPNSGKLCTKKNNNNKKIKIKIKKEKTTTWKKVPSSNVSCVRKTAALFCIIRCIFNRIFEVGIEPFEFLILSSHAIVFSPASFSKGFCFSPTQFQEEVSLVSHTDFIIKSAK